MGAKVLGFTLEDGAQDSFLPLAHHLCVSLLSLRFSPEQYGQHILRTGHLGFSDPGRLTEVGQDSVSRDSSQSHPDSLKNLKVGEAWSPATRNGAQGSQRRREAGHQLSRAQRLAEASVWVDLYSNIQKPVFSEAGGTDCKWALRDNK